MQMLAEFQERHLALIGERDGLLADREVLLATLAGLGTDQNALRATDSHLSLRALQSPSAEEPRQELWSVLQRCRCRVGCSMSARWRGGSQHRDTGEELVGVAEHELKMNVNRNAVALKDD